MHQRKIQKVDLLLYRYNIKKLPRANSENQKWKKIRADTQNFGEEKFEKTKIEEPQT